MKEKWMRTSAIFDSYERRFAQARAEKPYTRPWNADDRQQILMSVKRMLRYDEALIPQIHDMTQVSAKNHGSYDAIAYRYQSWDQCYGAATLYLPHKGGKLPLVFVCCGHGDKGRHTQSYAAMGHRLASLGIAAMIPDNIGQGDRNPTPDTLVGPDHWLAVEPFRCGFTLQGLIVAETVALIRYMGQDPRFDPQRFAACGNSGGGTLTMFLAALAPELCAIASCGYPSEISYLLQKERRHCACNLLVGQAYEADMWEIYSLFAPKPLLLEGGKSDNLIPVDLARRNARKVQNTYVQLGADRNFSFCLTNTQHSWELEDINVCSSFLCQQLLGYTPADITALHFDTDTSALHVAMPSYCLSTSQLCQQLSHTEPEEETALEKVFPPTSDGIPIDQTSLQGDIGRGNVLRVFAQFECALYRHPTSDSP